MAVELLPDDLSYAFGLQETRMSIATTRIALAAFASTYRRLPRALVTIPSHAQAVRRLRGQRPSRIVAWTERQLFGLTRQVTGS